MHFRKKKQRKARQSAKCQRDRRGRPGVDTWKTDISCNRSKSRNRKQRSSRLEKHLLLKTPFTNFFFLPCTENDEPCDCTSRVYASPRRAILMYLLRSFFHFKLICCNGLWHAFIFCPIPLSRAFEHC